MARVNFDDEDEQDSRWEPLTQKLGDPDKARGMLVRFWRLAQKSWGMGNKAPLPRQDFDRGNLGVLLEVGWAVEYGSGIQAYDAEARFKWYWDCCERSRNLNLRRAARRAAATGASHQIVTRSPPDRHDLDTRSSPDRDQIVTRSPPDRDPPVPAPVPALLNANVLLINTSGNPQADRQQSVDKSSDDNPPPPDPHDYGESRTPDPPDPKTYRFDKPHLELARWMFAKIAVKNPTAEKLRFAIPEKWANELRLAVEADGIQLTDLTEVLRWAFNDRHWQMTIQSPSGLRRNWSTLLGQYNGRDRPQFGQGEAP